MAGVQAEYLNDLSEQLKIAIEIEPLKIKVVKGHKKKEVFTGVLIGIISAWAVCNRII